MKAKILILISLLGAISAYTYYQWQKIGSLSSPQVNTTLLKELPDVPLKTFKGEDTSFYKELSNDQSKMILVHFWGTWCGPCETEMPSLLGFLKKFDLTKMRVLFVATNDQAQKIEKFFEKYGPLPDKITLLIDNDEAYSRSFGSTRVPETFLFNSQKSLIKQFSGPQDWSNPYYSGLFQDLSK